MEIITFSGVDGSGKTLQMKKVKKFLESKKRRVFLFHLIDFSIAKKISSLGKRKSSPASSKTSASPMSIFLRKVAFIIDAFRFRLLFEKIKPRFDFLLSDRFFQDQAVNIFFLEGKQEVSQKPLWLKAGELFLPQISKSFCLLVPPAIAQERKKDKNQDANYYQRKSLLLKSARRFWNFEYIDAQKDKEKVFNQIKDNLDELHH